MAQLHVDAFLVLGDRIGQTTLASHLIIENFSTRFSQNVAVFGHVRLNFLFRDVRAEDVHGLVVRLLGHGDRSDGD